MSSLLTKKTVIKVVLETTKGTKVAGDQALVAFDLDIAPTAEHIERNGTGLYRGHGSPGVIGAESGKCSFGVELRGNGSSGCEVGLAILLQACGLKKTAEVYQMHSDHSADKTISIDVYEEGRKKSLAGASGTFKIEGTAGQRAMVNFDFDGVWQAPVDAALPANAPSTTTPMMMKGGTFTLGGASPIIDKFGFDMGGVVVPRKDVTATGGIGYFLLTDLLPLIDIDPEAALIATYDYYGIWKAGTEAAVSYICTNGTVKVTIALPKVQTRSLGNGDRDGIRVEEFNGQCDHSSGNDAVTMTFAAA